MIGEVVTCPSLWRERMDIPELWKQGESEGSPFVRIGGDSESVVGSSSRRD